MPETKIGFSQLERPAPLWYRRFVNAMAIFIIPGATAMIEDFGLPELTEKRVLKLLIFTLALLKGIQLMLGNGQSYTDSAKTLLFVAICYSLSGCMSLPHARTLFERQPNSFADLSAKYFPCVTDSAGRIPIFTPVNNTDYTPTIDSLQRAGDSLRNRLEHDRQYAADSISDKCAALVGGFQIQTMRLLKKIDSLQRSYRPCLPDSIPVPYPVKSSAELQMIHEKEAEIGRLNVVVAKCDVTIARLWSAVGALTLLVTGYFIYKFRKK
ncbi:hypothetical protein SAMN05444266_101604 [Chitinophaga jiangningensis]|uniref:Uncharacterized protein n=1 Tax=Chitinophaga jiangningensis TaxID=1419482 RepID=A0A1M6WF47_9BACT|nr:hypothetical protein [Chitinophaga jiangningensis]SHK92402.1 hypothetical protein SAMN05444266_101604 [Chitinophaga jiangningensis]